MKKQLIEVYEDVLKKIKENSDPDLFAVTTPKNTFQEAQYQNRPYFRYIMEDLMLKGSGIKGSDNLRYASYLADAGKSVLILSAHVSNMDVPALYTVLTNEGKEMEDIFEKIVFIAGRKLTEGCKYVKACAEMFTRIVISAKFTNLDEDELRKALAINKASQKLIGKLKNEGSLFLLYPTGTRTRMTEPKTQSGIREIYNYIRKFDYIICCGIQGNLLPPRGTAMIQEHPKRDKVVFSFGPIHKVERYLKSAEADFASNDSSDKKQWVVDRVMDEIYSLGNDLRKKDRFVPVKMNAQYIAIGNTVTKPFSLRARGRKKIKNIEEIEKLFESKPRVRTVLPKGIFKAIKRKIKFRRKG